MPQPHPKIQSPTKRINFFRIAIVAAALAIGLLAFLVWREAQPPVLGGDFRLIHRGEPWSFKENSRPLNLVYIGYAKCPDVCPLSLTYSSQAFRGLSAEEKARVQLVFISVDTEHDTPQAVADYAAAFDPDFIGLTGTEPDIRHTVDLFGASYMVELNPKSYLGYSIAHTDKLFFLNPAGRVVDVIPSPRSSPEILKKIKEHL